MRNTAYNTRLGKGCGLIEETLTLLSVYEEGMTRESLADLVHKYNILNKCTETRSKDIVKIVFFHRYMETNPKVPVWLREIRDKGLMLDKFKQLLYIYTARENAVFYEFITEQFNSYRTENNTLPKSNIKDYIKALASCGNVEWSESICIRMTNYVWALLKDFDFIDKQGNILPYEISKFTVLYLMHELHFEGLSDAAIWNHEDWQLFGLDKYQVLDYIMLYNLKNGYIAQSTGDLITISWSYKNMEEFINGTL